MVALNRYPRDFGGDHPFALSMQNVETASISSEWYQESEAMSDSEEYLLRAPSPRHQPESGIGPPVHHSYSLYAGNVSWMTVELRSWSSSASNKPVLLEGRSIAARLRLDLRSPDSIKSITVSVRGRCSVPGYFEGTFLHFSETLWDSSMGDPRTRGMFLSDGFEYPSKLHGEYEWNFKTSMLRSLDLTPGQESYLGLRRGERLPPSLKGQHGQDIIGYELAFRVKRHGIRCGSSLTIPVEYANSAKPIRPSLRRQMASQKGLRMPRFDSDPAGWRVLPDIEVQGHYYQRPVVFSTAIALSHPLTYYRGGSIPFMVFLKSKNPLVVELITTHRSMRVCLRRGLFLRDEHGEEHAIEGEESCVGRGFCVPRPESHHRKAFGEKILQGEIELSKDLTPSFSFGRLELKYYIELLSLKTAGFTPKSRNQIVERVEVVVASTQPKSEGYQARSFLPTF